MKLKNTILQAVFLIVLTAAFAHWGCNCPPSSPCCSPNPIVTWESSGFSVTPDSIGGATTVTIYSSDAQGAPLDTFNIPPKTKQAIQYGPQVTRPIHLRFQYKSSSGEVICEDQLSVDDSQPNGGPIVALDIIMGLTAPNTNPPLSSPPTCPQTSATGNAGMGSLTFSCATNDWFQIKVVNNDTEQQFGIFVTADFPNKIAIYRSNVYSCLTNPACEIDSEDGKSADIEVSSSEDLCTIGGSINTGNGQKTITISGAATCQITAFKKQ